MADADAIRDPLKIDDEEGNERDLDKEVCQMC